MREASSVHMMPPDHDGAERNLLPVSMRREDSVAPGSFIELALLCTSLRLGRSQERGRCLHMLE